MAQIQVAMTEAMIDGRSDGGGSQSIVRAQGQSVFVRACIHSFGRARQSSCGRPIGARLTRCCSHILFLNQFLFRCAFILLGELVSRVMVNRLELV